MVLKIEDYLGHMTARVLILAALLGFFLVLVFAPNPGPEPATQKFYATVIDSRIRGLPSEAQMKTLRPLMSLELDTLIETARHSQLHFIHAHPDEKPPWIEGNLFGSLFEGMRGFLLEPAVISRDTARIPVNLAYLEKDSQVRWTDTAVLTREGSRKWRVSDIRFGAKWDFKPGPGLREVLKSDP
jgi:hypothetical protein